ncbi:MAG: class II aldolase/adducin family protein [Gammaproteobacteria bacterium]|nr:class II aldolase/adducin family protein [Gammaproteobacteria bacterium]
MEEEGVIKFDLHFTTGPPLAMETLTELNTWRHILWKHALIGQDPARYEGCGFGNISQRTGPRNQPRGNRQFVISGTQTGHLEELDNRHYASVKAYDAETNQVVAEGPVKPSSESMTHGVIYDLDNEIYAVLHVHSPDIWNSATSQGIPVTNASVEYGTPEMSREVERLYSQSDVSHKGIFSMGGHKDGIVAFGHSMEEAGNTLLTALAGSR